MAQKSTSSYSGWFWNYTLPPEVANPALVVLINDWIYGLLPYCGPGTRYDAWNRERLFQDEIRRFLNQSGIATLSLDTSLYGDSPPSETELIEISSESEVRSSISQIVSDTGFPMKKTVLFGHGLGARLLCKLASSGLKPAGYIIASGLYSDFESLLTQKYLPISKMENNIAEPSIITHDPETDLILNNFGKILNNIRKGRENIRLSNGDLRLDLYFPKELFFPEMSSFTLYSYINAPALLIHGSGDLDIHVSNVFFLEQKLNQHIQSVSRIILPDCDHWFREMPTDCQERFIERLNGNGVFHAVDKRFYKNILIFINDVLKLGKERISSSFNMLENNEMMSSAKILSDHENRR